ncbi:MAG: cyclic nucleotide-binding domain-containing protein [Bryobacterales bacterium]|nr:cyclic nucleotide-binding domain-containing protein [Bryobacterales bacterium]
MMETLERILAAHAFFEGLEPEYLKIVTGCASNVRLEAGAYVFREGEEANQFYLLRQGKVAVEIFAPQSPPIIVETVEKDEILGWSWLVHPYHWRFDARAVETTRAIALDGKCLREKCEANPALGYALLKRLVQLIDQRLQATRLQLLDVYANRT